MIIIGVDYHPSDQYIALVDTETAARPQTEDRPGGRPTAAAIAAGKELSAHLGTLSGES